MEKIQENIILKDFPCLNLERTLFCGQAFRWTKKEDGSFHAVVRDKIIDVTQNENEIIFYNSSDEEIKNIIKSYFDKSLSF